MLVFAALLGTVLYIESFFCARKKVSFTWIVAEGPSAGQFTHVNTFYFSSWQPANTFLYYSYFPIHALVGGDADLLSDGGTAFENDPAMSARHSQIYVRDLQIYAELGSPVE